MASPLVKKQQVKWNQISYHDKSKDPVVIPHHIKPPDLLLRVLGSTYPQASTYSLAVNLERASKKKWQWDVIQDKDDIHVEKIQCSHRPHQGYVPEQIYITSVWDGYYSRICEGLQRAQKRDDIVCCRDWKVENARKCIDPDPKWMLANNLTQNHTDQCNGLCRPNKAYMHTPKSTQLSMKISLL